MSRRSLNAVVRYLRQLTGSAGTNGAGDAELLERYVRHRDEAAFELLLWRHGTLVFNVCRRILPREQDAEDAFQATFLAFVRKAGSISRRGSVASWLYKVAYRVALEASAQTRKTAAMEKSGGEMLAIQSPSDPLLSDVRPILDSELIRLPERLRRPIILCYLEGKSNEEAARELGCRLGTIYSRLSRGREMLRQRLERRGVTLSVAALTAALTASAVEASPAIPMVRSAVRAALAFADPSATPVVSPRVATLAEGVLRTMFVTKLKIAAVMLVVLSLAVGGVWTQAHTAAPQAEARADDPPPKPGGDEKKGTEPIPVKVVKPKPGGTPLMVTRPAEVVAAQHQQIVPLISGTVKEVLVDIGDRVKKGQTLLILDAPLLARDVEEATASLELAEAQVKEARAILGAAEAAVPFGGDAAKFKVEQMRASVHAANAKVKLAQAALNKARIQESFTQLKAAFDGVIMRRTIDPGNFVQPSDSRLLRPLLTVQRIDILRVVVKVVNNEALLVKRGMPVELELPDTHGGEYKVSRFSPSLEGGRVNREMTVEIDVPNADNRLLPGMTGEVRMPVHKTASNSLVVPLACLHPDGNILYVIRNGRAKRVAIPPLGFGDDRNVEVEGIEASDLVIVNPKGLSDGTPVKVEKAP